MKKVYFIFFTLYSCAIFSQNLLNTSSWEVGSNILPDYKNVGLAQENSRELGVGPYGNNVPLWKGNPSGDSNADGGYESPYVTIDHTKTYRLSVWIKKTNSSNGTTYFGLYSKDNNLQHSTLGLNNSSVGNAYFWYGDLPTLDKWYLLVGYIHQSSYNSTVKIGGIYDGTTGVKVLNVLNDFKFASTAVSLLNRASLFYDPVAADSQYFYSPRIEEVNGSEPTIEQLISTDSSGGSGNTANASWIDDGNNVYYNGSGNVGIGTNNPQKLLHLKEPGVPTNITEAHSPYSLLLLQGNDAGYESIANNDHYSWGGFFALGAADNNGLVDKWGLIRQTSKAGDGSFRITYGTNKNVHVNPLMFIIDNTGNVGIGTTTPDSKLAVNGKIHAKEVKVDLVGWPDYVFKDEYNLPSLKEVEQHIQEKGHLQNIPSAAEVEKNGVLLGEMNKKLLEKIEELTLYIIEQEERIVELEERDSEIKNIQEKLKFLLNNKK